MSAYRCSQVSVFQFVAALVSSLAWPVAVVAAAFILRKPIAAALPRLRKIEALGVSAELDAVEQAREGVEQELSNPDRDVDVLVARAAEFGWLLGKAAPDALPGVQVDRSNEIPTVVSSAEEVLKRHAVKLDFEHHEFAWKQLADRLEGLIVSGELKHGQQFPPLTHIAREYGVGLNTARRAVHALNARGLATTVPTLGTFVGKRDGEEAG